MKEDLLQYLKRRQISHKYDVNCFLNYLTNYLNSSHRQEPSGSNVCRFSTPCVIIYMCTFVFIINNLCNSCLHITNSCEASEVVVVGHGRFLWITESTQFDSGLENRSTTNLHVLLVRLIFVYHPTGEFTQSAVSYDPEIVLASPSYLITKYAYLDNYLGTFVAWKKGYVQFLLQSTRYST